MQENEILLKNKNHTGFWSLMHKVLGVVFFSSIWMNEVVDQIIFLNLGLRYLINKGEIV
jgi:hypothetical protein